MRKISRSHKVLFQAVACKHSSSIYFICFADEFATWNIHIRGIPGKQSQIWSLNHKSFFPGTKCQIHTFCILHSEQWRKKQRGNWWFNSKIHYQHRIPRCSSSLSSWKRELSPHCSQIRINSLVVFTRKLLLHKNCKTREKLRKTPIAKLVMPYLLSNWVLCR